MTKGDSPFMDNLTIILIMIFVMIVLPIIFARLSGKNPMEISLVPGSKILLSTAKPPRTEEQRKRQIRRKRKTAIAGN